MAKQHGVSEQTIYSWRKRFGRFAASEVRRVRQLEAEHARLRKLVVERDLEIEVMKEVAANSWCACRLAKDIWCTAGNAGSRCAGPAGAPASGRGSAPQRFVRGHRLSRDQTKGGHTFSEFASTVVFLSSI